MLCVSNSLSSGRAPTIKAAYFDPVLDQRSDKTLELLVVPTPDGRFENWEHPDHSLHTMNQSSISSVPVGGREKWVEMLWSRS